MFLQLIDMVAVDGRTKAGKWALLVLPLITVLREGMEAVVFVGGVSLGEPATSIPLAAIVGILCGVVVGYIIYAFATRTSESPTPCLPKTPNLRHMEQH